MNKLSAPSLRAPGRPAGDEAEQMRERLLDAAEQRFGEHGYAATSIRSIVDQAGVTTALVHYYFGNKKGLLLAVLDRALEPAAGAITQLAGKADKAPGLETITDLLLDVFDRHPNLPRLIVREVLLSAGELRELFLQRYATRLGGSLVPVIERQRANGAIHAHLEAPVVTLLILSLCLFPVVARPLAEQVLGVDYSEAGKKALRVHMTTLLNQGLLT